MTHSGSDTKRVAAVRMALRGARPKSEAHIHKAGYKSLRIAEIKRLIAHYAASARAAREIAQLKNNASRRR